MREGTAGKLAELRDESTSDEDPRDALVQRKNRMTDQELADELIERMNRVIRESEAARDAISRLIQERIQASDELEPHPTIQVELREGKCYVGFLGILNGTIGTILEGDKRGWGYVCARFDSKPDGTLVLLDFQRTNQ